jgi:hypothetical protein
MDKAAIQAVSPNVQRVVYVPRVGFSERSLARGRLERRRY